MGRAAWIAAGLFLTATVVLSTLYFKPVELRTQTLRFWISPPEKNTFSESFALSPDGRQIAYVRADFDTNGIYLSAADGSGRPELVYKHTTSQPVFLTDWSNAGLLCFWTGDTLYVVRSDGVVAGCHPSPRGSLPFRS